MKVVILCGGSGTRLREQTEFTPKPLIPIGGVPMVVHIMRWYAKFGFNEFVLALGYKQEAFKMYFKNFDIINNDTTLAIGDYRGAYYQEHKESYLVTLCDTGENTFKGGRLKRVEKYIDGDIFFMTYGDAVADINIMDLLTFHFHHGKIATVTGIHPTPRFGELHCDNQTCISFTEKPVDGNCWANGGFFVFDRAIFNYLSPDEWCDLEVGPLELLASKGELMVYKHEGFWGCMDTIRDMAALNQLWKEGKAKWRVK